MLIPPKYTFSPEISQLLSRIEASKAVIDAIKIPIEVEQNIRRKSTLRSALFSARIEGSDLTLDTFDASSNKKKAEVYNILKATEWLYSQHSKDIHTIQLQQLHKTALHGLIDKSQLGNFRAEVSAIFNSAGIAIYMPPPPSHIRPLVDRLIKYAQSPKEPFIPIRASLAHYIFEKIHPFMDGNGRVGRLLLQKILAQYGYGMKGLLSIEEYLDNHRSSYYRALEEPEKELSDYIVFMLTAIADTAEKAQALVSQKQQNDGTDFLLPRRAEIYTIIKEQRLVNFDMIRRRFLAVNERTLRFDLKQLQDAGLIRKRGTTKGVYYEAIKSV